MEGRDADVSKFPFIPRQSGPRDPTPTQEESSVGDYAGIMPVSPQPLADGATTGHTVQFEKRKSWGHTPSLERKEWEESRGLGGKNGRLGTIIAGEGSALGLGSHPSPQPSPAPRLPRRGEVRVSGAY